MLVFAKYESQVGFVGGSVGSCTEFAGEGVGSERWYLCVDSRLQVWRRGRRRKRGGWTMTEVGWILTGNSGGWTEIGRWIHG